MRAYCAYENRPSAWVGAKLLALSLERHATDFTLYLGVPEEAPELPEWREWMGRRAPHVELVPLPAFLGPRIKEVKAVLMLRLLDRGLPEVTWLDTDLLVLRDPASLLAPLDEKTVLVAQDMDYLFAQHAALLKHFRMRPRRSLEHCVTTCVLRVTPWHRPLLENLIGLLRDPLFLEEVSRPRQERRPGFGFEQKIVELLLCAERDDLPLPAYPVRFLPEGSGIIQEMGATTYGIRHRLRNGLGWNHPYFVHAADVKPWEDRPAARAYRSASVYSAFAETYREDLPEVAAWANTNGWRSRVGRLLSFGNPHGYGWPRAVAGKLWRLVRTGSTRLSVG